ncbi:hypothetical protein [Dictyobacter kobayashii]|uniref:DUF4190 domain-containing protein n=1 Tax=Dictyobacter kobayashii TaxID=2014872 RepID=A0A402AM41_9CHLR|nr:hypothetical protein [Dictyobacter kobayashii]GCE20183.1 hypothetical protein KDK_39830 [Dictyobacter kobayashii]
MRLPIFIGQHTEAASLREKIIAQRIYPTEALRKIVRRIDTPTTRITIPTEDQRHFILTGFTLSCVSIPAAFLPICGMSIAITGLFIGFYGRQATLLKSFSTWSIVLSAVGLLLSCINTIVVISIYIKTYM